MSKKLLPGENPTSFKITLDKDWMGKDVEYPVEPLTLEKLDEWLRAIYEPKKDIYKK